MNPAYQQLLTALAHEIGLQDVEQFLETEELLVDGLPVTLYRDGDEELAEVVLLTFLGPCAPERLTATLQTLMEANCLWVGTGGATLGLNPQSQQFSCAVRLPLDTLTGPALASLIDAFVDTASFWKRWIAGEAGPAAPPLPADSFMLRG